jgi:hypothetical protein
MAAKEAKASGDAVEILDERTESTQTFANPNGSFELRGFSGPRCVTGPWSRGLSQSICACPTAAARAHHWLA